MEPQLVKKPKIKSNSIVHWTDREAAQELSRWWAHIQISFSENICKKIGILPVILKIDNKILNFRQ